MAFFVSSKPRWFSYRRFVTALRRWVLAFLTGRQTKVLQSGQLDPQFLLNVEAVGDETTLLLAAEIRRLQKEANSQLISRAEDAKTINAMSQEVKTLRLVSRSPF